MATLPVPSFSAARAGLCLALMLVAAPVAAGWPFNLFSPPEFSDQTRDVIFVGNNWEGTVNVFDAETYEPLGTINAIPDKSQRITEIYLNPVRLLFFQGVRLLIGEGNHQYVDDMYSSNDGRLLVVSRPSFADVVALDVITGEVVWRFQVDGAISRPGIPPMRTSTPRTASASSTPPSARCSRRWTGAGWSSS